MAPQSFVQPPQFAAMMQPLQAEQTHWLPPYGAYGGGMPVSYPAFGGQAMQQQQFQMQMQQQPTQMPM